MNLFHLGVIAAAISTTNPVDDPYFSSIVLLLHANGANASTSILDSSFYTRKATLVADAQLSTAQSIFGGSSILFDGTSDYISYDASTDFDPSGNFTVEFWYRPTDVSNYRGLWGVGLDNSHSGLTVQQRDDGALNIVWGNGTIVGFEIGSTTLTINTNYFVQLVVGGGDTKLYLDGVLQATAAGISSFGSGPFTCYVGHGFGISGGLLQLQSAAAGYIDDLRITQGVARTAAVPPVQFVDVGGYNPMFNNIKLLMHFEGTNGTQTYTDDSQYRRVPIGGAAAVLTNSISYRGLSSLDVTSDINFNIPYDALIGSDEWARMGTDLHPLTIEIAMKANSGNLNGFICGSGNNNLGAGYWWGFLVDTAGDFKLLERTANPEATVSFGAGLGSSSFRTIAIAMRGTAHREFGVWVDGTWIGAATSSQTPLLIGGSSNPEGYLDFFRTFGSNQFLGKVDEIRVSEEIFLPWGSDYLVTPSKFPNTDLTGYRFYRISVVHWSYAGVVGTSGDVRIAELQYFTHEGGEWPDQLLSDTTPIPYVATASSSSLNSPAYIFNKNLNDANRWISSSSDPAPWVTIDMGVNRSFSTMKLSPDSAASTGYFITEFNIEVSNTGSFTGEEETICHRSGLVIGDWTNNLPTEFVLSIHGAHRYWRLSNMTFISGVSFFEISEIQLLLVNTVVSSGKSYSSSITPDFGSVSSLFDGSTGTRCYWTGAHATTLGFNIVVDMGSPTAVDRVKQAGFDTSGRHMTGFTLEYSDDNTTWTSIGSVSNLVYPGNSTLSAPYLPRLPMAIAGTAPVVPVSSGWSTTDRIVQTNSAHVYTLGNTKLQITSAVVSGQAFGTNRGLVPSTSGKHYFEIFVGGSPINGDISVGVMGNGALPSNGWWQNCTDQVSYRPNGQIFRNGVSLVSTGAGYAGGDIIGVAVDLTAGTVSFYTNNVFRETATLSPTTVYPTFWLEDKTFLPSVILNTAASGQTYLPPAGYSAWE